MDQDKKKETYLYCGIIVFLFIIIIAIISINSCRQNTYTHKYLRGLWIADEKFCEDSGISGMIIYIGEKTDGVHNAYIIMYSNGAVMIEKKISILTSKFPDISPLVSTTLIKNINLTDLDVPSATTEKLDALHIDDISEISLEQIMPLSMIMEIDFTNNCMTWKDEDIVYAKLYKDNYSSAFE
jgi:hypothetical protein